MPVREMTRNVLGDIVISWGWSEEPESFYRRIKEAKTLATSDDELFGEFVKEHTPPMEDMVERQKAIQRSLHDKDMQQAGVESDKVSR